MPDRLLGILVFLPVPVVLGLFTRAPLGAGASIGLGVLLMATHRLYARPFALSRADRRCLWCGGEAGDGPRVPLEEPSGPTTWRACGEVHRESLSRVFGTAFRWRWFLRAGILGSLALFLCGAFLATVGWLGPLTFEDTSAFFRLGVSLTVLPFGWLSAVLGPRTAASIRVPFPVHIQALIGTAFMLWLFRIVGIFWIVQVVLFVAGRP
ncbi:MAG TPA: hypothetical protein VE129_03465 [Thermoanaerobaculia bacterium]|nr:hypothetical protein [Thermoanaerobaculia bacterium]